MPHRFYNNIVLFGVVACFVLSGFAALLYQTAWMRQFSLVFGTSELAVAAVLAAYMGGLALGASVAARYIHRITRPVLFYGLLEAGIALSALAVPFLLDLASMLYGVLLGGQPEPVDASGLGQSFFYLIIAFVVLAIPTAFMGATLPLLTQYVVQSKEQIGTRVGLLYATNTAGAIAGTVVAGFLLLPALGLNGTVLVGVGVNALVFILAALIANYIGTHDNKETAQEPEVEETTATDLAESLGVSLKKRYWILPLMLLSGANSFIYEVLWTRLLGHILGGSITAFSTMLAGFLGGIAIGSAIASRFANSRIQATQWFIGVQCGIALMSLFIYQSLPFLVPESFGLKGNVLLAFTVLLPAAIFIGATFPLAVRILATEKHDAASSSARVYSWNTVGAIVGATAAAFFLIPALKYEGAIKFAVVVNALLALGATVLINKQPKALVAAVAFFVIGITLFYRPSMPEAVLRSSPVFASPTGEIRYYEVGRSATVLMIERDGFLNLRTNGLPEASTNLVGAPPDLHNQRMLSMVPVLARPDIESMLIVGLGAGVALEGVPKSVKSVDVIELEPEVVRANQSIGDERAIDPLKQARVKVTINDARSALTLTSKKFDAIVSQPSHPWTAGASHLYTREFMALAKEHLTEDGVYLQWMNTQFLDEFLLRSLCATVLDVFPYVRVYQWNSEVLFFLGSDKPLNVETDIVQTGRPMSDDPLGYLEQGVGSVEDVLAALALDQQNIEAFAIGGDIITDDNNYMATMSAQVMNTENALRGSRIDKLLKPYDPILQADSVVRSSLSSVINYPYVARRLELMKMRRRAIDLADSLVEVADPSSLIMIALGQKAQGESDESQKNLLLALQAEPNNQQARYALLQPWFEHVLNDRAVPSYVSEELANFTGTGAATFRGWTAVSKGQLKELVTLDAILASVLPSDLWYETSVKLRADWRIKLTTPELQPRMYNEATKLIDSAIAFYPNAELLLMRMESTYSADDLLASVETARRLVSIIGNTMVNYEDGIYSPTPIAVSGMMKQSAKIAQLLQNIEGDAQLPEYKLALLKDSVKLLDQGLESLMDTMQ